MFIETSQGLIILACSLFAVGLFGINIGNILGKIFGGKDETTSTAKVDFQRQIREQKEEFTRQLTAQAEQSRKTMMMMGGGAVALFLVFFMFLKK